MARLPGSPRVDRLAPLLLLVALLLIGFARLVARPGDLLVDGERPSLDHARPPGAQTLGNDLTRLFLPLHQRLGAALAAHGRVPGWDPAGFGGRPLVGNPQAGLWYPPVWLAWRFRHPAVLGWITVAHLLAAGLGSYVLARRVGLGRGPALVAGGAFELSPYLLGQAFEGHYPHVWAVAWYPWAFAATLSLLRGEGRLRLALPAFLALALLTGHPQEGYYLLLALGLWTAAVLVGSRFGRAGRPNPRQGESSRAEGAPKSARTADPPSSGVGGAEGGSAVLPDGPGSVRILLGWGVAGALMLGMTAIEWWPDRLAQAETIRSARRGVRQASQYTLEPIHAAQLLSPGALGGPAGYLGPQNDWETRLAAGALVLGLAAVAGARSPRRGAVVGWGTLVAVAVLFAAGREAVVFPVFYRFVPGMDRFRVPSRSLFLAALGAAQLAGLGLEALNGPGPWRRWALGSTASSLGLTLALVAWPLAALPEPLPAVLANLRADPMVWLALLVPPLSFRALDRWPGRRRRIVAVVGLCVLAELAGHALVLIRVAPAAPFTAPDALARAIDSVRPQGPFRIRARDAFLDDAHATAWGLEKTNIDDAFQLQRPSELYEALYTLFDPPRFIDWFDAQGTWLRRRARQGVLDRMNVALLVTDRSEPDAPWPVAIRGERDGTPFVIYRNPTALPRAYVVPRAEVAPDDFSVVTRLGFVPGREAVILPDDPLAGHVGPRQPFTPAAYRAPDPDRVEIEVTTTAPGLLVVADTGADGWSATLDGQPVPIRIGNRAQRVVTLPEPGAHRVVMTYVPPGLALGRAITRQTTTGWLLLALAAGFMATRRAVAAAPHPGGR